MAVINGTSAGDFIHRAGDGQSGGGLNEVTGVTAGADSISGDVGSDRIFADAGTDTVNGDEGNDTIIGGQGKDRLFGGVGSDVFQFTSISDISGLAETINGGSDIDTIDFQAFNAFGPIDLSAAVITGVENLAFLNSDITLTSAQLGGFSGFFGSGAAERLILSDGGLVDLSGASFSSIEEIRGNALANEIVLSGVVTGQTVNTQDGDDSVTGGDGADRIDGGAGLDGLTGGLGNDTLFGGDGADTVEGNVGNDLIHGGGGVDSLEGGAGNDTFRFTLISEISGLTETIAGGADIDVLDFQNDLAAGAADISKSVLSGLETLLLGNTQLTLKAAQLGAFTTIAGSGFIERIILSAAGNIDLSGATISSIEEFRGSGGADGMNFTDVAGALFIDGIGGNDTIRGTQGNDLIEGGGGADVIFGNEGSDVLRGEQGADNIEAGIGNDTIQFAGNSDISGLAETIDGGNDVDTLDFATLAASGRVNLSLATISNIEILRLSDNVVTLTVGQLGAFETIQGSGFIDRIQISAAGLVDLTNATVFAIDEFTGTSGADTFLFAGGSGNLVVNTLGGADMVSGGTTNDTLLGGGGNDTLGGGGGDDFIVGGVGTDSLTGGTGVDRFDFNDLTELGTGAARDVVTDFVHGQDIIDLVDLDSNINAPGNQPFVFIGSGAFTAAGQLRYAGGILSGDVDGDGAADFQIAFTGNPLVTASDILL
jgi:Ca2+-binding RTX toxin-like protein